MHLSLFPRGRRSVKHGGLMVPRERRESLHRRGVIEPDSSAVAHCATFQHSLQCVERFPEFAYFRGKQLQVLTALRLIILELPGALKHGPEFLVVRDKQVVGRQSTFVLVDAADRVVKGMELVVQIIEGLVLPFSLLAGLGSGLHHIGQVDQGLNRRATLRLLGEVLGVRIEQITAPAGCEDHEAQEAAQNELSHDHSPF